MISGVRVWKAQWVFCFLVTHRSHIIRIILLQKLEKAGLLTKLSPFKDTLQKPSKLKPHWGESPWDVSWPLPPPWGSSPILGRVEDQLGFSNGKENPLKFWYLDRLECKTDNKGAKNRRLIFHRRYFLIAKMCTTKLKVSKKQSGIFLDLVLKSLSYAKKPTSKNVASLWR